MQKHIQIALVAIFVALGTWARADEAPSLPSQFTVTESILRIPKKFTLKAGGREIASVQKHIIALTPTYDIYDDVGKIVGKGRRTIFSWGAQVEVYDSRGNRIGTIKEQIWKSLFKVSTVYSLLDARGAVVAESAKIDFFATSITVKDKRGRSVATLSRPALRFADTWTVNVYDDKTVDSRVLILIGVYKTDADNSK